jgi:hypothetical protein
MDRILTGIVVGLWVMFGAFTAAAQQREAPRGFAFGSSIVPALANWVVLSASGSALWRPQGEAEWRRLEPGEVLFPSGEVETGGDGEVTLVTGGEQSPSCPSGDRRVSIRAGRARWARAHR